MRALSETAATALGIGSMSPDEEVEAQGAKNITLENMISYSGDAPASLETFDLALFKRLNAEFAAAPLVPAPREQNTATRPRSAAGAARCWSARSGSITCA